MAPGLSRTASSCRDTSCDSNLTTRSKLRMAPSSVVSVASRPSISRSSVLLDEDTSKLKAAVEASIHKPSLNKRKRDESLQSTPKKKDTAICVGYYIDALDKKMLWGEAKIVDCNLTTQKIKVHFVGWSKKHDLWTDVMSISAHGRFARRMMMKSVKSWDGDMHLFEDMLGTIASPTSTWIAAPAGKKRRSASLSISTTKKANEDKKAASATRARYTEKTALKTKYHVERSSKDKPICKRVAVTPKVVESNGNKRKYKQRLHTAVDLVKAKRSTDEKQKVLRISKRQKRKGQQSIATQSAAARSIIKKGVIRTDDLPLYRDLELNDGTVLDFSVHRENARKKREAMQSFVDKCALVWKNQLRQLSI